jgi:hypothetical protein
MYSVLWLSGRRSFRAMRLTHLLRHIRSCPERPVQCTRAGGVFKCTYIGVDVRIDPTRADARMTGLLRSVLTLVFRRCLRQPNNIWGNRTPGSSIRLSTQGAESDYMETSNYLHIHILSPGKAGVKNNLTNVSVLRVRIGRSMIKTLAVLLHNRVIRVKGLPSRRVLLKRMTAVLALISPSTTIATIAICPSPACSATHSTYHGFVESYFSHV